ncbi:anti-sigma factor antagonist BldG [Ignavibacteriales bacterium]
MNYTNNKIDGISIFTLNEIRLDANISGLVKGEFTSLVKENSVRKMVIDLSSVESCDSSGLSTLLVANRLIGSVSGSLRIVCPSKKILTLIKITQLDKVLKLSNSIEEAMSELKLLH